MATLSNFKINGLEVNGVRELKKTKISITFDNDSIQANINIPALNFLNEANQELDNWENGIYGVIEGTPFEMSVESDATVASTLKGYVDHSTRILKSTVESEASIVKTNGLNGFHIRSQGITMALLEKNGIMPKSLGVNIPYIVENRKTNIEKFELLTTAYSIVKTSIDEIFKFINIAADLTSGGFVQAGINLATSLANIIILITRLVVILKGIQEAFFPFVQYHRGIQLITFLEKGCNYMGYSFDAGTFTTELEKVTLCPHKTDESNDPIGFLSVLTLEGHQNDQSGILKPSDFGYVLSDAFELAHKLFFTKVAIIGEVVTLLPFNDPFWVLSPSYTLPDVKLEESPFMSNGVRTKNLEEIKSRTLIEYAEDTSDYFTITNVNNSVSETIREPVNISNPKNVILKGIDIVKIPYALCVRKEPVDSLFELFKILTNLSYEEITSIEIAFGEAATILGEALEPLIKYVPPELDRAGAMKVENDFFSLPKIVYLEESKIPENFNEKIGAPALYNDYHSYKSPVPGIKNPLNDNETNQKLLFSDVKIPFGVDDFNLVINNSYFNTFDGGIGKFTSVLWDVDNDTALTAYYIFENYLENIKETTL